MSQKTKVNKFLAGAVTATMVATAVVPTAALAAQPSDAYSDVKDLHADTLKELDRALEYGLMSGYQNAGLFKPKMFMNRGQVAKALAKYEAGKQGMSIAQYFNAKGLDGKVTPFADVPKTHIDKELYQASLIVKDAGTFTGVQNKLNPTQNIERGHMATVLVRAFGLKATGKASEFADLKDARTQEIRDAIQILKDNGIAKEVSSNKYNPNNAVQRIQMASFLVRSYDEVNETPGAPGVVADGITAVKAINDTTVEVTFKDAVDEDFIKEAEKNGKYFRVYLEGDTAYSNDAIKSATLNFSNDGKTAEFTLGNTLDGEKTNNVLESGKKYTVALMNGDNKAADIVHSYGPVELKESAAKPEFEVSALSDKIIVKFGEKMKSQALDVENYEVFDEGGKSLGKLIDFLDEDELTKDGEGKWEDATKKTTVEFPLYAKTDKADDSHKHLLAGKTYKLHVNKDVKTDKNKTLSEKDRTITVKTPTVKEAQPKATTARVNNKTELVVVFDQDVVAENANPNQIDVKTTTGKTVAVEEVKQGEAKNELVIVTKGGDDDSLEGDVTYRVSLPANAVSNAVFPNASNDSVSNLSAKAQADIEIKSVKAELKADPKNKKQANLYLTFDQRPNLEFFKEKAKGENVVIKDGSDVYEITDKAAGNMKYVDDKTIVIENVKESFKDESGFQPEKGTSYKFEIKANVVKTDAFGDKDAKVNQSKLSSTFGGVSVTEPIVDKVTLVSEKEIKIDFKEDISAISENDIYVSGIELLKNGRFDETTLNGTSQLKSSVSGSTLTLTTKDDTVFRTGFDEKFKVEIKANSFTSKDGKIENDKVVLDVQNKEVKYNENKLSKAVDNAAPVMVGAESTEYDNEVKLTYSEALEFHPNEDSLDKVATLFSVKKAANNAVGAEIKDVEDNTLVVVFNDQVFDEDTIMNQVEVTYAQGNAYYIMDAERNKAKKSTITGVQGDKPKTEGDIPGKDSAADKADTAIKALENDIKKAEALLNDGSLTEASKVDLEKAITKAKEDLKVAKKDQDDEKFDDAKSKADKAAADLKKATDKVEKVVTEVKLTELEGYKVIEETVANETSGIQVTIANLPESMKDKTLVAIVEGTEYEFKSSNMTPKYLAVEVPFPASKIKAEEVIVKVK